MAAVSNVADEGGASGEVRLYGRTNASRTRASYEVTWSYADAGNSPGYSGSASRDAAQDTDAIHILFESGNIASGTWALYGYQ